MKQYRRTMPDVDGGVINVTLKQFVSRTWNRGYVYATMFFDKEAQFELMRRIVGRIFKSDVDLAHDVDVVLECVDSAERGDLSQKKPELDYDLLQDFVDQLYDHGKPWSFVIILEYIGHKYANAFEKITLEMADELPIGELE